jgi:hypothetical protein
MQNSEEGGEEEEAKRKAKPKPKRGFFVFS